MNCFVLLNHKLKNEQIDEIMSWGVKKILFPPSDLRDLWGHVPPEDESLIDYVKEIEVVLATFCDVGDYVIVQGEAGLSYLVVQLCFQMDLVPVHATTERFDDGSFYHCQFRRYETLANGGCV